MKEIIIKGACEHNLKSVDVNIPYNQFVVITGVSGSGKSSLAFDTIFREGQRQYLGSFSLASTQLISKLYRPDVEEIRGLSPTIAVNQSTVIRNPRSTVGTLTELYDYLRLLFARFGVSDESGIDRNLFSFNHHKGACPLCKGLGVEDKIDPELLISDPTKSIREGALVITAPNGYIIYSQVTLDVLNRVCNAHGFHIDIPWKDMTDDQKHVVSFGSDRIRIPFGKHTLESRMKWTGITAKPREEGYYKGIIPVMEEILKRDRNKNILRFVRSVKCMACGGSRLNEKAVSVKFEGKSIVDLSELTIGELHAYFMETEVFHNKEAYEQIREQLLKKTGILIKLGLSYLTINRESTSLSGGEAQRIRLGNQLGNGLEGITYVFDEPSIGLHESEQEQLLEVLNSLVDQGNNLIVVEHDERTILNADYLVDVGPKAGIHGGEVLFQGSVNELLKKEELRTRSLTQKWLLEIKKGIEGQGRSNFEGSFYVRNACKNNLCNIDVEFKYEALNVITGVSGAGKSSLVRELIDKSVIPKTNGADRFSRFIEIDQSPIGRTPRSNPATYTKLFDLIRELFGKQEAATARGWNKSRFSFNNKGGRCETCEGAGYRQVGMHFLGNVDVLCEACNGKRFNNETLEITYQGKNIYEVLELKVEEAATFFEDVPKIRQILAVMMDLGLGYIGLGQPSTTLSGGEAQRIKLASELSKTSKGKVLYILDEPTTGLHHADVQMLLKSLHALVEAGQTIVVVEHHPDLIRSSDWVIDLGPGSGKDGGQLIDACTPDSLKLNPNSLTGRFLNDPYPEDPLKKPARKKDKGSGFDSILLKNVATHNLKHIDVEIPRGKITTVTGVSGSGKSSLVFDTLFAEGQRRFMESISTYARTFMKKMDRADVELIEGLTPVIAIGQKRSNSNPRSTVGTLTEIYDYYRLLYSRAGNVSCPDCGTQAIQGHCTSCNRQVYPESSARAFSFNEETGACPDCKGLGIQTVCDPDKLVSHPERSILEGAMDGHKSGKFYGDPFGQYIAILKSVALQKQIDLSIPWKDLDHEIQEIVMFGTADNEYDVLWEFKRKNREGEQRFRSKWTGFANLVNEEYERKHADKRGEGMLPVMKKASCKSCHGQRLNEKYLNVKFEDLNISELSDRSVDDSISFFEDILGKYEDSNSGISVVIKEMVPEILKRLKMIQRLGIGYLPISRTVSSLSGGELQRLRLAAQLGSGLCNITYVLDEPTVGLHAKDTKNLIAVLKDIRDAGNHLVIVEHDSELIKASDHIIELGPGAGSSGGSLLYSQSKELFEGNTNSKTAVYLSRPLEIKALTNVSLNFSPVQVKGANCYNIHELDLELPLNGLTVITGVSGSGKSTFMFDVLQASAFNKKPVNCKSIINLDQFHAVLSLDQHGIGNHPSSIVATYTGLFDDIRAVFARESGLNRQYFSFNNKAGRCGLCQGAGQTKIAMDFLSDVWVQCEACKGKRYNDQVLACLVHDKSIADVLEMDVLEAISYFKEKSVKEKLEVLVSAGLGYLKLGQSCMTLSGGEAQRLKLAREIMNSKGEQNLYLLDEPTTGLHFEDIEVLCRLFKDLIEAGHALLVIEHNLQLIAGANWIVDFGPEGGRKGGKLMFQGPVSEIIKGDTYTGKALQEACKCF